VILIYKFCVFPTTAFENHFPAAFHEYFGGGFLIEEFHSYRELFQLYGNPDMRRGMQQLNFTAPVYAAIGYSIGTWLGMYYRVFPLSLRNAAVFDCDLPFAGEFEWLHGSLPQK